MKEHIGFIGQGWIGKHYADDFEARGFEVVRYSLDPEYIQNQAQIASCTITFIAVPTPTTPEGFDDSYLVSALQNIGHGTIAVIKSTTTPGLIAQLQEQFSESILLHSPEFLVEHTAAFDAAHPQRNIIGIPRDTEAHKAAAERVLAVLPPAPYSAIMSSTDSELVKYAGNCFLYTKVLFMNTLYDVVKHSGGNWNSIREAFIHDPRIGASHTEPIHASGRGAGGHCFIKDYEAFLQYYKIVVGEDEAFSLLKQSAKYNRTLLEQSGKDIELLRGVYGDAIL